MIPAVLLAVSLGCLINVGMGHANDELSDRDGPPEGAFARPATIQSKDELTLISMPVQPHEVVLVLYADGSGGPAYAYRGIQFPGNTDGLELRLEIEKPVPAENKTWQLLLGVTEVGERYASIGGQIRPAPKDEEPLAIGQIVMPLNIEGVEVHLFPFMIENGRVGSMMVVIGKDRELIRKAVRVGELGDFDWNSGIEDASRFLPGLE